MGEVALIAQFKSLGALRNKDLIGAWTETEFKDLYPQVAEYAELPPFQEVFGVRRRAVAPTFALEERRPVARYNFRSEERHEQIQIQRDRIAYYWQSGPPPLKYPRFPKLVADFRRDFEIFERYLKSKGLGEVTLNQCAVSYTNVIPKGEGWDSPEDLSQVVTFWGPKYNQKLEPDLTLEDVSSLIQYVVLQDQKKLARLYVGLSPTLIEPNDELGMELELIVRGEPASANLDGAIGFFEMGRRHIVTTFDAVTTDSMHRRWGRE